MAFWVTYDHLFKLIVVSMLWSLAVLAPGAFAVAALISGQPALMVVVGVPMGVLAFGVIGPVGSVGIAHMVKVLIDKRDGSLGDAFRGVRLYGRRAAGAGLVYLGLVVSLGVSVWFYAYMLRERAPWLGFAISAAAFWALVFVCLSALYAMPGLVQKREGVLATLRLSALLVLDNPLFTLGVAAQIAALTLLAIAVPPVLFFLYGGAIMAVAGSAYEMLSRKYENAIATREAGAGVGKPAQDAKEDPDQNDDYLNRGFRDFLFPWKG